MEIHKSKPRHCLDYSQIHDIPGYGRRSHWMSPSLNTADTLQVAFSGEGVRAGTEGEQMVRDLQGSRQALDEKLATSDIQLFGRPAAAAGSRPKNGHADRAYEGQPGADSDEAASEDESEGEDASGSRKQGAFSRPFPRMPAFLTPACITSWSV